MYCYMVYYKSVRCIIISFKLYGKKKIGTFFTVIINVLIILFYIVVHLPAFLKYLK